MVDKYVEANVELLRSRSKFGMDKYGANLERTDLTPAQWAQHAIEEALDFANYLQVLKERLQNPDVIAKYIRELERVNQDLRQQILIAHSAIDALRSQLGGNLGPG